METEIQVGPLIINGQMYVTTSIHKLRDKLLESYGKPQQDLVHQSSPMSLTSRKTQQNTPSHLGGPTSAKSQQNAPSHHSDPTLAIRQHDVTSQQSSSTTAQTQQDATVSINQVTSAEKLHQGSTGMSKLQAFGHEEALDRIRNYSSSGVSHSGISSSRGVSHSGVS